MFTKQAIEGGGLEQSAIKAARFEEKISNYLELLASEPATPGRGEAEFGAVQDGLRKQVCDGFFQNAFAGEAADLQVLRNVDGEFHERVIKKRDAALDRGGHAHVVLFHEQFDKVGLNVGIKHALKHLAAGMIPVFEHVSVCAPWMEFESELG